MNACPHSNIRCSITGTTEPFSVIFIAGGKSEETIKADDTGNLNIEVTLKPGENMLSILAQASGKTMSNQVLVVVKYEIEDSCTENEYGDVTGDGNITVQDAIVVLRHIVGLQTLDPAAQKRAKVTAGGGNITVQDAILILRRIVGLITKFPVEE